MAEWIKNMKEILRKEKTLKKTHDVSISQQGQAGFIHIRKGDFRAKKITRKKERYYIMIKRSIHWKDGTILKMVTH